MEDQEEKTLAVMYKEINEKLDLIIQEQKNLENEMLNNKKATMQKLQKLQEHNEIDDMRNKLLNEHIDKIAKLVLELEKRLY